MKTFRINKRFFVDAKNVKDAYRIYKKEIIKDAKVKDTYYEVVYQEQWGSRYYPPVSYLTNASSPTEAFRKVNAKFPDVKNSTFGKVGIAPVKSSVLEKKLEYAKSQGRFVDSKTRDDEDYYQNYKKRIVTENNYHKNGNSIEHTKKMILSDYKNGKLTKEEFDKLMRNIDKTDFSNWN